MRGANPLLWLTLICAMLANCKPTIAQPAPVLTWITNSSVKLEQVIGDQDWAALAKGTNLLTASQTITRFHILGTQNGASFDYGTNLIFLFGDTFSENKTKWAYDAADPLALSSISNGDTPLQLNFYTNTPYLSSNFTPVFVQPPGIDMSGNKIPSAGISLSNGVFLVCESGFGTTHDSDFSVLVSFNLANLLSATNTYTATNIFGVDRVVSMLTNNLPSTNRMQGHFILTALREFGTNVMMFGVGEYRTSDIYLSMCPTANFTSGQGTLYFTGLTNGQPTWSPFESNSVPVVQDNPTNGPAWPNDNPSVGKFSAVYATNLNLWLMTFDGGRNTANPDATKGVYFSYAPAPWGPWATPQLIFNKYRDDHADGGYIYDADSNTGPAGPTIDPQNNPTNSTPGEVQGPELIERFTRVTNSTLIIYYIIGTWNPYTAVKMRSQFAIFPVIDPASLVYKKSKFGFSWIAPTNIVYQIGYSTNLLKSWITLTNLITSTNGTFNFTDTGTNSGGFGSTKYYRLQSSP